MQKHVLIQVSVEQLKQIIVECIQNANTQYASNDGEDKLLKIDEVTKLLSVSKVTIHDWKRKGIIPFHRMGRRIFFKKREVIDALRKADVRGS